MKICKFKEVELEIAKHIREHRLIPVLGSGFSSGSEAFNGFVPTGEEMKKYMIDIIAYYNGDDVNKKDLEKKTFSQIAIYYKTSETTENQKKYIRDNFTHARLDEKRTRILEIDWMYIYTLNMDDAIENNSGYKRVVCSNRRVDFSYLENNKCVIKLHGDANAHLLYQDDQSQIFDFKQYARSITTNESMLDKLRHDFTCTNLLLAIPHRTGSPTSGKSSIIEA